MPGPVSRPVIVVGDRLWAQGHGSASTLPWHPQIQDGEDYEFWLYRLAAGYGLSKVLFCKRVPGIDSDPRIASALTGIPIERLTRGTLRALDGLQLYKKSAEAYKTLRKIGHHDPDRWLTWHLPHYGFNGGEFCRLCLAERPIFKLNWCISLFVSCPTHGCLLSHLCGTCGTPFTGYHYLRNVDLSGGLNPTTKCSRCHGSLLQGGRITQVSAQVANLEQINAELMTQRRCVPYFSALRRLVEALSTRGRDDRQANESLRAALWRPQWGNYAGFFEKSEPKNRQKYLLALTDLFKDWPSRFVEILAGCQIKWQDSFFPVFVPTWLRSAACLAHKYDPHKVASVRAEFWSAADNEGWLKAARFLYGMKV